MTHELKTVGTKESEGSLDFGIMKKLIGGSDARQALSLANCGRQ